MNLSRTVFLWAGLTIMNQSHLPDCPLFQSFTPSLSLGLNHLTIWTTATQPYVPCDLWVYTQAVFDCLSHPSCWYPNTRLLHTTVVNLFRLMIENTTLTARIRQHFGQSDKHLFLPSSSKQRGPEDVSYSWKLQQVHSRLTSFGTSTEDIYLWVDHTRWDSKDLQVWL